MKKATRFFNYNKSMSIKVLLDGQDITASLNKQYPLPSSAVDGIYPSRKAGEWYDLLACISENEALKKNYFNGGDYGVHEMQIVDSSGVSYQCRVLLRMKYSARNH